MTAWDWLIVFVLNGGIILYGLYLSRGMRSSADWFLAGRRLPWWLVGLSMYATAIDASDLIADSGGTYTLGMSVFVANWVGVVGGWVLAIIGTTVFLTLTVASGWDTLTAWSVVGAIALVASIYTALGGLRSVAITDALQFGVMTLAGLVIWFIVWGQSRRMDGYRGPPRRC